MCVRIVVCIDPSSNCSSPPPPVSVRYLGNYFVRVLQLVVILLPR